MTSLDYGKTFTNIDDRIEGAIIKKTDGIFKNPLDPKRVSRFFCYQVQLGCVAIIASNFSLLETRWLIRNLLNWQHDCFVFAFLPC